MGLDARVRYTKMVIWESISGLLQEKPFHKISLTEVCKRAGINRSTFYKYYKDLYDWKEQLEQKCLQRTKTILESCVLPDMEEILTRQFRDMRENAKLYALIASPHFESNVLEIAITMVLEKADAETKKYLSLSREKDYRRKWDCYFVIYGCLGVIDCWIKGGMQEETEKLATYYMDKFHEILLQNGNNA